MAGDDRDSVAVDEDRAAEPGLLFWLVVLLSCRTVFDEGGKVCLFIVNADLGVRYTWRGMSGL